MQIFICKSDEEILSCFDVLSQLRPHLHKSDFVATIRRLEETQAYRLIALKKDGAVCAVGGFRKGESLAWGVYIYVDDLVTDEGTRSSGCGKTLLNWIEGYGKEQGCKELHLDSGVQRHSAHRFYLRERMDIVFFHFKKLIGA